MSSVSPSPSPGSPAPQALVRGAGPAGTLAALALAEAGWTVTLVDPASVDRLLASLRAYAFTHSSRRLLQRLGLWERLSAVMQPFDQLDLSDLGSQRGVRFSAADLWGASPMDQSVGWIARHRDLLGVLLEATAAQPAIQRHLGDPLAVDPEADLIVAADGARSPTREGLGIGVWSHAYDQQCLTARVTLRGGSPSMAWERLRPEGPFALLPVGEGRFQVVWSAPGWRCRQLESLSPAAFLDALAPVLPAEVDVASLEEGARVFPVQAQLARRLRRGRTILVGETAHRCHPVAGQGLNLSWRDVAVLHRLARRARAGRLPLERLPAAYARRRWLDVVLTLAITDALVRLFSNRHPLLLALRRPAVLALGRAPWLRRCLLGVMTNGPCQPFLSAST
ncbi:MAG: FAD-dependent monooxygenase [Cyanobacteriota bacterium]|nr:FAD-dependent monooxygenase [Cyanobacteriota bacterium]